MNPSDDLAMAMTMAAQFGRKAPKEARDRRRLALVKGDGPEAKRWRAVHKLLVKFESDEPADPPGNNKPPKEKGKHK